MIDWKPLPPQRFVWEKYLGKVGFAASEILGDAYFRPFLKSDIEPVGYCPANEIKIRSRAEGFVIMVTIDGEETWLHVAELPNRESDVKRVQPFETTAEEQ